MRLITFTLLFCFFVNSPQAQLTKRVRLGLKAGVNFANVTNTSSINGGNRSGFMVGGFLSPAAKVFGYRTELIYSKQGYDYKTQTTTGKVNLDYILLPQLFTINAGKWVQLQAGPQVAILLNATADSSKNNRANAYTNTPDYFSRFDYGVAAGLEFNPFKGLIAGARYNISLGDPYKEQNATAPLPPFIPASGSVHPKNNVVQIFIGYKF